MPIIAIAAAVFAVVEISTIGLAAMSIFEAIGAIGAITNAIGMVTGNQDLQKVGQVMAIGGGLGRVATNLGLIDASTPVIGGMTVRPPEELGFAAAGQTIPGPTTTSAIPANAGTINTDTSAAALAPAAPAAVAAAADLAPPPPAAAPSPVAPPAAVVATAAPGVVPPIGSAASLNLESGLKPPASSVAGGGLFSSLTPAPDTWFSSAKNYIAPFTEFAKENQVLVYGALQAGGTVIAGLFDPLKPAQAKKAEAEATLLETQNANMAAPLPGAYRKPKLLRVQPPDQPVGLINTSTA